jgi:hypothetical protein
MIGITIARQILHNCSEITTEDSVNKVLAWGWSIMQFSMMVTAFVYYNLNGG